MWISVIKNFYFCQLFCFNMDLNKIWLSVLSELELTLTRAIYQTMFKGTGLVSIENGVATVSCPNPYLLSMIEQRYYSLIKSILDRQTKENLSLVFVVKEKDEADFLTKFEAGPLFEDEKNTRNAVKNDDYIRAAKNAHIRTDLTFDTYAVSSLNQFAYAAATAVYKNLGTTYNPLFVWGGVGVGKTHLMQAIGNAILKDNCNSKVIFCMGEEFTNEIVDAIQNKSTKAFKEKYRSVDLLLVDDVQFLAGKNTAQEEFFHTFNAMTREGGQIVMTCDRPPAEIKIEDRLKSRFEAGLIVDIQKPDLELRTAILMIKSKQKKVDLPIEVAQLLASEIDNARALEGSLTKLIAASQNKNEPLTIDLAKEMLGKKQETIKKAISPNEVIKIVSDYYGIKIQLLKSEKRDRPIATPRQIVMYLLKNDLGLTLMQIAGLLEKKDHTTVIHGVDKISKMIAIDLRLATEVSEIKRRIYG